MCFLRTGENIKPYPARTYRGKRSIFWCPIAWPAATLFQPLFIHISIAYFSMCWPSLSHSIEVARSMVIGFGEVDFESRMVRTQGRGPEGINVSVHGSGHFRRRRKMLQSKVAGVQVLNGCAEFLEARYVAIGKESSPCRAPARASTERHVRRSHRTWWAVPRGF